MSLSQAPDGFPPNVLQQIPAVVLRIAAEEWYELEALPDLFKAAAGASQDMQQRQLEVEQRVMSLEHQLAAVLAQSLQPPPP